jgi:hypothetical protein
VSYYGWKLPKILLIHFDFIYLFDRVNCLSKFTDNLIQWN